MRVYELAKQYEVSSKAMLSILEELGILAKSHMTVVSDEDAALVAERFAKDKEGALAQAEKSTRYEVERARPKPKRMTAREKLAAKRRQAKEEAEAKPSAPAAEVEEPSEKAPAAEKAPAEEKPAAEAPAEEAPAEEKPVSRRPRVQVPEKVARPVEETPTAQEPAAGEGEGAEEPAAEAPEKAAEEKPAEKKAPRRERVRADLSEVAKAAERIRAQIHDANKIRMAEPEPQRRRPAKGKPKEKQEQQPEAKTAREILESMRQSGQGQGRRRGSGGVDASAIQKSVRQSLSRVDVSRGAPRPSAPSKRRGTRRVREDRKERAARHRAREEAQRQRQDVLRITEFITVQELAQQLDVKPTEIIGKLMGMGTMATINQRLERDVIELLAADYEIDIEWLDEYGEDVISEPEEEGEELSRSPVVTVMGHVDHGKTSLLDYIRKTNVIAGEAGGITQHIGAYQVETGRGKITFLDTPGHEAFSAMRARGAQVTDIVVIVVAADDKVMPQTVEAIDHARASKCPMIIAINKIDLPAADPMGVKQDLTKHNVVVEDFGGDVQSVEISAKKGQNVDQLLEAISLQAELMELKAVHEGPARGTVIESEKDPGRGISFTVLVHRGTLHKGDPFVAGLADGRVRSMRDELDREVEQAVPGQPVVVLGANDVPAAGDNFAVLESEREARDIAAKRQQLQREQSRHTVHKPIQLENLWERIEQGELVELPILVKGDVAGSVEAVCDALMELSTEKVAVNVIRKGVGGVTESDVNLAATSGALIIGFHLHPPAAVRDLAKSQNVDIRTYDVIYEAVDEVRQAMAGLLKPVEREVAAGAAEVRDTFKVPKAGLIAGCYVTEGTIKRNARVRVIRDQVSIYEGTISSLRRFKEDAREVQAGYECGIGVAGFQDIKVGDVLQTYDVEEVAAEL